MDDEIQSRRHEEIEALQAFYGNQLLPRLPSNEPNRKEASIDIHGPWYIQLLPDDASSSVLTIPILEIRLPNNYPLDDTVPTPLLHNVDHLISSLEKKDLMTELMDMYQPEMEVTILWAEQCRMMIEEASSHKIQPNEMKTGSSRLDTALNNLTLVDTTPSPIVDLSVLFLSYNHLLHGKSHKKEAQIVSAASNFDIVGLIVYGTPGIIGIFISNNLNNLNNNNNNNNSIGISTTEEDVIVFIKECNRIGKKCTLLDVRLELNEDGIIKQNEKQQHMKCSVQNKKSKKKGGESSKQPPATEGLYPILVNLLGEERVSNNGSREAVSIVKNGLNAFASCADLKKVIVKIHGLDETIFQQIIGVV